LIFAISYCSQAIPIPSLKILTKRHWIGEYLGDGFLKRNQINNHDRKSSFFTLRLGKLKGHI
jgi:hypothetical protein